jgi:hypothetical protein
MDIYVSSVQTERIRIYWDNRTQTREVNAVGAGVYPVTIDNLAATTYEFAIYSYDSYRHESLPVKVSSTVYDNDYLATLWNRGIVKAAHDMGKVNITWLSPVPNEVRSEITYVNNQEQTVVVKVLSTQNTTVINDFGDWKNGFTYSTLVLPEPTAIDTFTVAGWHQDLINSKILDDCESTAGWVTGFPGLTLDPVNPPEGNNCLSVTRTGVPMFQKTFTAFNTEVTKADGYFALYLYISDVSKLNLDSNNEIEITSGGDADRNELHWDMKSLGLVDGWNKLELKLSSAIVSGGDINLSAVNFFRIYLLDFKGDVTIKLDGLRFY